MMNEFNLFYYLHCYKECYQNVSVRVFRIKCDIIKVIILTLKKYLVPDLMSNQNINKIVAMWLSITKVLTQALTNC